MAITLLSRAEALSAARNAERLSHVLSHAGSDPTQGTNAIIAGLVFCGLIFISVVAWKIQVWRTSCRNCCRMESAQVDGDAKQKKSAPQDSNPNPVWVSQIQSEGTPDPDLAAKDPFAASVFRPSLSKSAPLLADENRSSIQSVGTPPPAYALTSFFKYPTTRAASLLSPDPPLPPIPAVVVDKAPARTLSPVPYSDSIAPALASPTSFSFSSSSASQRVSIIALGDPNFPRHMNVVNDFFPTLPDELAVNVGEGVQLLDEYTDGWCMIRRVGFMETETGVIPRCCLQDPPDVIPIERGMSSPGLPSQGGAARLMNLFA